MVNIIKIILAALFFLCLVDLPYGYYQFVRFVAMVGFLYLAYDMNNNNQKEIAFLYLIMAVLFQPLFKIALGRELWNIVDVIAGIFLLISIFIPTFKSNNK